MRFWAKVNFREAKEAENLIRSFFEELDPESSITIRGNEAKLEIFFKTTPKQTIEAISQCEIKEFYYGKILEEYGASKNEQKHESEVVKTSKQVNEKATKRKKKNVTQKGKKVEKSGVDIIEIKKIAEKCNSYEQFTQSVLEWIGIDKKKEIFMNFIKSAGTMHEQDITWKAINENLKSKGYSYSQYDQMWCARKVANKFKNSNEHITILKLIKQVVKYKNLFDSDLEEISQETAVEKEMNQEMAIEEEINQEISVKEDGEENISAVNETFSNRSENDKEDRKMKCMPYIPEFQKALESIDLTKPIEERLKHILNAMGAKKKTTVEYQDILDIINKSVNYPDENNLENFLKDFSMQQRMLVSQFINSFVAQYSDARVKLVTFIKELKDIVLIEKKEQ